MKCWFGITLLIVWMYCLGEIDAHGILLYPVGRSSRWRYDGSAPANYDDNGLYCGGFWKQTENGGRCGLCGDDFSLAQPRPNELGGKYGQGVIVKSYISSSSADVIVRITANHLGFFSFHLCNLDVYGRESEQCFDQNRLKFSDGSDQYYLGTTLGEINLQLRLPAGLVCQHCVLRWTYTTGNNWGVCADGTGALGCGDQENFKNCADISILSSVRGLLEVEVPAEVKGEAA
ncbi:uncharacterized protein LOC115623782 [Scaptodrosophila lebanonensis]|uniref:Uncharacterized protein LOC115623782 n=1 Tax=Drosophila lebanonensis TaxID=7225 RepID=A0A6J2TGE6_DROLE|nr:uncharacterized protein LOC115623782 [Scaptodrosophila lebanonensis]